MKPGYIYVLTHPSDSELFKIGITTRDPEKRLAEHNRNYERYAGAVVRATGQPWELKEFHAVPDPYWAESVFWASTPFGDIPYRYGIEIERMNWEQVQLGLDAAKQAGVRPGPGPLPDHVYANTASIRKRLKGRGITLRSHVQSINSGMANFRCDNGHEWRATPGQVGEGHGCPECGMGTRDPEAIRELVNPGVICLLTHPENPGLVKIWTSYSTLAELRHEAPWCDWEIHRYRNVEEVALAESLIWRLLGKSSSNNHKPIEMDLKTAEQAFRKLHYAVQQEIALIEKAKEAVRKF